MITIRSQSKRIIMPAKKIEVLYIPENHVYISIEAHYVIKGDGVVLGEYSSKERALEVMDMIHREIAHFNVNAVFQMPLDEEVT